MRPPSPCAVDEGCGVRKSNDNDSTTKYWRELSRDRRNGKEVESILENVAIVESERQDYGTYRQNDGRRIIPSCPLSDDELRAYNADPENAFKQGTPH